MSSYLDKLYRFILRAILAIWLLYWLEREGCHQFAFCAFGQHNGSNFHSYQEIALKWKPIFILHFAARLIFKAFSAQFARQHNFIITF